MRKQDANQKRSQDASFSSVQNIIEEKEQWDPGISGKINTTKEKIVSLMTKIKNAKIFSDVYIKRELLPKMDAKMQELDAKMQCLLITSKGIRDG